MIENECKNTKNSWFSKKIFYHVKKSVYFCTDFLTCPGGGMVDTVDSKSAARKGVRVQVPPGVRK